MENGVKFKYKQKVRVKTPENEMDKSFYDGEIGYVLSVTKKAIVSEKPVCIYLVQIDDKFELRELFPERLLEAVK